MLEYLKLMSWGIRTVRQLSVADVLQVGHRVVVAHLGAGVELLQPLQSLSRRKFGARLRRDAARHRIPHSKKWPLASSN